MNQERLDLGARLVAGLRAALGGEDASFATMYLRAGILMLCMMLVCIAAMAFVSLNAGSSTVSVVRVTEDQCARARVADARILMLGNSLITIADTDTKLEALSERAHPDWDDVFVVRAAYPSYRLHQHYADVMAAKAGEPLSGHALLDLQERCGIPWDTVVLHAQSQVPGFEPEHVERKQAVAASRGLVAEIREAGAEPMLMMTWGYWNGDATNAYLYPTFAEMSVKLEQGYREMAAAPSRSVRIAPVGLAFRQVHDAMADKGMDPKAKGSLFRELYLGPSHPSELGGYLSAATIARTIVGRPIADAQWAPEGIDAKVARRLREAADEVAQLP